ncbi:hypothetical protein BDN72DRAFT_902529 [Pluteus cervinus]|uniref:Uncharacterized protein n=1 Tax=Pluteus cervinus TaxID=181527 RepID=A0ACD3AC44_9AGAR|nr:hypothetical protein BDN72DRAFT_902529 [Pluteus cervinus]
MSDVGFMLLTAGNDQYVGMRSRARPLPETAVDAATTPTDEGSEAESDPASPVVVTPGQQDEATEQPDDHVADV